MEDSYYTEILDFLANSTIVNFFKNVKGYIPNESDVAIIDENRKALIATTIKESPIDTLKNYTFVFNDLDAFVNVIGESLKNHNWNISNAIEFFYNNPSQKEIMIVFAEDDVVCSSSLPETDKIIYVI